MKSQECYEKICFDFQPKKIIWLKKSNSNHPLKNSTPFILGLSLLIF